MTHYMSFLKTNNRVLIFRNYCTFAFRFHRFQLKLKLYDIVKYKINYYNNKHGSYFDINI